MTAKAKSKAKAKSGRSSRSRRASDHPRDQEILEQLSKARAGLAQGRTLEDLVSDMEILVAIDLLHPEVPDLIARMLREEARGSGPRREGARVGDRAPPPAVADHELLGVSPNASGEEIEAAHRRAIVACHPDRFASLSPVIQRTMDELAAKLNGARARLLGE